MTYRYIKIKELEKLVKCSVFISKQLTSQNKMMN